MSKVRDIFEEIIKTSGLSEEQVVKACFALLPTEDLADILGKSERRIREYKNSEIIPEEAKQGIVDYYLSLCNDNRYDSQNEVKNTIKLVKQLKQQLLADTSNTLDNAIVQLREVRDKAPLSVKPVSVSKEIATENSETLSVQNLMRK